GAAGRDQRPDLPRPDRPAAGPEVTAAADRRARRIVQGRPPGRGGSRRTDADRRQARRPVGPIEPGAGAPLAGGARPREDRITLRGRVRGNSGGEGLHEAGGRREAVPVVEGVIHHERHEKHEREKKMLFLLPFVFFVSFVVQINCLTGLPSGTSSTGRPSWVLYQVCNGTPRAV